MRLQTDIHEVQKPFHLARLEDELAERTRASSRYSLRAFARSLGVDAGALSRIFSQKQNLSLKLAHKVALELALAPQERSLFLNSVAEEKKMLSLTKVQEEGPRRSHEIEPELFKAVSELHHYALLELLSVEKFKPDPQWIARRLGISSLEARFTLERLVRLGFITKEKGRLKKTNAVFTVKDKCTSTPALRRQQKEILARARDALDNIPIEKRICNSMTMAIAPEKLPLARKLITDFTEALCEVLEDGKRKRVYQFNASLFPLDKENDQ